jgi:hypothetical protein
MLTRKVIRSTSSLNLSSVTRTFTTTNSLARTPLLADVTPAGVAEFDAKKKQFRERLAEQNKKEISM